MDWVMCTTCSDSEDDTLQEADEFKDTACTVNISKENATPDVKPPDIKKRRIIETGKQELVAREVPGKAVKEIQIDRSNANGYVIQILNTGGSEVQKPKNLIEDGQGQASKLVKESEGPQESQMPCVSGGSSTNNFQTNCKPDIKPLLNQFLEWVKNNKAEYAVEVPSLCTKCNITFSSPALLNEHCKNAHNTDDSFMCPDCTKTFPTPGGVIDHRFVMHNTEKIYQCSECNAISKNAAYLNQHHRLTHGLSIKCSECSEEFSSLALRKRHHWEVHNSQKPIKCVVCSETFIDITKLLQHQKSHKFECPVCNITFNKIERLRKHEKTHVGSQFLPSVKNDKALNAGEVRSRCTECNRTFGSPANLKQHSQKVHSTEHGFRCPDCYRTFQSPGGVTDHRIVVHNAQNIYQCNQCKAVATSAAFLNHHYKLYHGFTP